MSILSPRMKFLAGSQIVVCMYALLKIVMLPLTLKFTERELSNAKILLLPSAWTSDLSADDKIVR